MKNRNTVIGIICFGLFILYFIFRVPYDKEIASQEQEATHKMSFEGRIIEISTNRGLSKVKLENRSEYIKLDESRNYSLTPCFIGDYLKQGSIIFKNSNSDTLYVKNEDSSIKAFFVLGNIHLNESH